MSVKAKFINSTLWMALSAAFNNFSSTIVFIALARLLTPDQFGIVALAAIIVDLTRVMATGGVVDILVERPEWDEITASSSFWTNLGLSLVLAMLIGGVAAPLGYHYYDETFGLVLAALSILPIIEGLTTVHVARLKRDFGYKAIAARSSALALLSGVIGIGLALQGWGVWALVVSKVLGSVLASSILWISSGWRPRLCFSRAHMRPITRPSLHLLGSQLAAQFNAQVVGLMIGTFLGPAALAQFRVGSRVLTLLSSLLISPIQASAISVFSRINQRETMLAPAYVRMTRACSFVAAPAYLGLAATGIEVVRLLFGPQWHEAGIIVSLNGVVVGAAIVMYFFGPAMTAAGQSAAVLKTWIAALLGNIATAAIALPFGLTAVIGGQVARPYLTLPLAISLLRRGLGLEGRTLLKALAPSLMAAGAMALILTAIRIELLADLGALPRLMIMVGLGPPLYLGLLWALDRTAILEAIRDLKPLVPRLVRRG